MKITTAERVLINQLWSHEYSVSTMFQNEKLEILRRVLSVPSFLQTLLQARIYRSTNALQYYTVKSVYMRNITLAWIASMSMKSTVVSDRLIEQLLFKFLFFFWKYEKDDLGILDVQPIIIGYYTIDCTIPKYIWTSAQMTSGHESKYISVLYSQLYNYLFIIYPTV